MHQLHGPIDYDWLGRQILNLEEGDRRPLGLPSLRHTDSRNLVD